MKNDLEPWLAKALENAYGGDGGVNTKPVVTLAGLELRLSARSLIRDRLEGIVKEINAEEGPEERQKIIDTLPAIFKEAIGL